MRRLLLASVLLAGCSERPAPPRVTGATAARVEPGATPWRYDQAAPRLDLAEATGWVASLQALDRLAGSARSPATCDQPPTPPDNPAALLAALEAALARARAPVARQNIIFHAALCLSPAQSAPWLRALAAGPDAEDAEDALVALAFAGDDASAAAFERLAAAPAPVQANVLVDTIEDHEALAARRGADARALLRAYRAYEVLARACYFRLTPYLIRLRWVPGCPIPPARQVALLDAWLRRWPGHPGSDDVALRIARLEAARGDELSAARWLARSAALPDQDVTGAALGGLAARADVLLDEADLERLAVDRTLPNRGLVQYARVRRLALRSPALALTELSRGDPDDPLAVAWRTRWTSPVPRGLDSGLRPLPADDPLRRVEALAPPPPARTPPEPRDPIEERLRPSLERLLLEPAPLARQARLWATLATLEERARTAPPDEAADLRYKLAAVVFHQPDAYFPAYLVVNHFWSLEWLSRGAALGGPGDERQARALWAFLREAHGWLRATEAFHALAEHPWPGRDRARFSEALAWHRLIDAPPRQVLAWSLVGHGDRPPRLDAGRVGGVRREDAMRATLEAFETCAREDPTSPLADDAARAAAYWRRRLDLR